MNTPQGSTPFDDDNHRDGNALAGLLADTFGTDLTTSTLVCATCGRTGRLAEQHLYDTGPGQILRCPGCTQIVARIAQTPTGTWLDLRGTTSLRIPTPTGP
ncbi:MAG: DUF6510 family protein [Actinocatenispora sp.]